MGTTNQQALEMMQKFFEKKKPAPKPMPLRGERTAKNALNKTSKKAKK
jgi:hypothetical protein